MNIRLKLTIPTKDGNSSVTAEADTYLTPFYVAEREVLSLFLEEYSERFVIGVREVIFYASIKADELVSLKLKVLDVDDLLKLKRQLTLCLATIAFANKFNSDFIKSMSRSKTLADFTVSTTVSNDTSFISNTIKDAQYCVADMLSIIEELNNGDSTVRTFVKGLGNCQNYDSNRLWHHRGLPTKSSAEQHASLKKPFNGRYYKNGGNYVSKT